MAGYRPGPEVRRDPYDSGDQPRDPNRPRRTLGPYGPREETGPGDDPYAGPSYDPPGYGRRPYGGSRPAGHAAAPPWERQPGPPGVPPWGQQDGPPGAPPRAQQARRPARPDPTGGAEGNERLTAATGAVLLVLFAAEGFTILAIHQMITLHFFLGMLLIGPVTAEGRHGVLPVRPLSTRGRRNTAARGRPPRCCGCSARSCCSSRSA